jgi:hypothetical protein
MHAPFRVEAAADVVVERGSQLGAVPVGAGLVCIVVGLVTRAARARGSTAHRWGQQQQRQQRQQRLLGFRTTIEAAHFFHSNLFFNSASRASLTVGIRCPVQLPVSQTAALLCFHAPPLPQTHKNTTTHTNTHTYTHTPTHTHTRTHTQTHTTPQPTLTHTHTHTPRCRSQSLRCCPRAGPPLLHPSGPLPAHSPAATVTRNGHTYGQEKSERGQGVRSVSAARGPGAPPPPLEGADSACCRRRRRQRCTRASATAVRTPARQTSARPAL